MLHSIYFCVRSLEPGLESLLVFNNSLPLLTPYSEWKTPIIFQLSVGGLSGLHLARSYSGGTVQKPSSEVFVSLSVSAPWIRCYRLLLLEGVCWLSCGALCKLVSCLVVVHVPILLPCVCPSTQAGGEGCRKPLFEVPSNKKMTNCTKKSPLQLWDQ